MLVVRLGGMSIRLPKPEPAWTTLNDGHSRTTLAVSSRLLVDFRRCAGFWPAEQSTASGRGSSRRGTEAFALAREFWRFRAKSDRCGACAFFSRHPRRTRTSWMQTGVARNENDGALRHPKRWRANEIGQTSKRARIDASCQRAVNSSFPGNIATRGNATVRPKSIVV
jgi:hypothetical protein